MQNMPSIPRRFLHEFLSEERPITMDEACGIRLLLFGSTENSFGDGWTIQGFKFRTHPSYGIIQEKAGPCGLIAVIQAYIIYELLFSYSRTVLDSNLLRPDSAERKEALARALSTILWQAGNQTHAIVAIKSDAIILNESETSNILTKDGLLEYVKLKYFRSYDCLLNYLYNCHNNEIEGGCILFVYSIILTHGIEKVKEEMDSPDHNLIGNDQFGSQELINLALTGKAVTNLFNGDVELQSGGESSIHKGISKRSKIGLLSDEYEVTCEVGSYLKDPVYPIWMIFGQRHYTVIFGVTKNIFRNPDAPFKLFYYDCLSKKDEDICFIINLKAEGADKTDKNLPTVVRCILTRWPNAKIDVLET